MKIAGIVKTLQTPEDLCLTDVKKLFKDLEKYLAVELEAEQLTNVFVGTQEPPAVDGTVWFKKSSSGNIIGAMLYSSGKWVQVFPPPAQVVRMFGRSDDIPAGYALVSEDLDGFTAAMENKLKEGWLLAPNSTTVYVIFDVVYVGL